jgi:hypothetical protein
MVAKKKRLKQKDKNKKVEAKGQKWEPKVRGQNKSFKVNSLPSLGFFCCFLACFISLCLRRKKQW